MRSRFRASLATLAALALLPVAGLSADFNGDSRDDLVVPVSGETVGGAVAAGAVHVIYGSTSGLTAAGDQFWTQNSAGLADSAEANDRFGETWATADFDNDGFDDLVIGVPGEDVTNGLGSQSDAGAIHLLYGSAGGLSAFRTRFWHQSRPGFANAAGRGDRFGSSLQKGDYNGDGHDDLAIGVHGETVRRQRNAGAVAVLYGGPSGLTTTGSQLWSQESGGVPGTAETADLFGRSLASGDFNGDGRDDLVVGVTHEDLPSPSGVAEDAGAVHVLYGTVAGLSAAGTLYLDQNQSGVSSLPDAHERFGERLAVGDFQGDGFDDLVLPVPREDPATVVDAGAVHVLYGSASGVTIASEQFWNRNGPNVFASPRPGDQFGFSVAVGDFDGNGRDDLAIGIPFADGGVNAPFVQDMGEVVVLYGFSSGLLPTSQDRWFEHTSGFVDAPEAGDSFGYSLRAADFSGDGFVDLAIGVPSDDDGDAPEGSGSVQVLYSGNSGILGGSSREWRQGTAGLLDTMESGDLFGIALRSGDFNGDGFADLAVPVAAEDVDAATEAGAVQVLYGSANRLTATGNQFWVQGLDGLLDSAEPSDRFGE